MFLGGNRYTCGQGNKYDKQHEVHSVQNSSNTCILDV